MTRFEFGKNWQDYLRSAGESQIQEATRALSGFLGKSDLKSQSFLDVGCGSGVHSFAAYLLGSPRVVSLDYDPVSVECCRSLKQAKAPAAAHWNIARGDILDEKNLSSLGTFDIVYSWGVLHHTGALWKAIDNACRLVSSGGFLDIAIYNKHWTSPYWKMVKRLYCLSPGWLQQVWALSVAFLQNPKRLLTGREEAARGRGMSWWPDLKDWLGGYPYEYATVEEITSYVEKRGFSRVKCLPNSGTGCSEFLFHKA